MDRQNQLEELLVDWGLERQQGNELSVEEVCKDNPELVPELSKLISDIKATDWLEEDDDDSDDDFIHLPDFSTMSGHADETRLPECSLTVEEFCQRLISSQLMDEEQVGKLRQHITAGDARSFAVQLVSDKKLTRFQATVLLEGTDLPLVLDRYVLLGEIGAGGMGAVYKALHQQMDRVVALKILPKEAVDSPDKVKRFQREVKAAAKLEHGNIVTAFDATESNGTHFLVMSYVNGSDLSQTVRKHGPVSAAKAVSYIAQAASGLEHAHNMGIVHRDIKPGNLLLDKKGKVQILDMGLARIETADTEYDKTVTHELTQAGMVMGTIAYLAPEQALDSRHADARSDIYSLGCTLFYLLTGKALYIEDTMMKTILAHREADIPSLCDEREGVPAELDAIFQKMVAKQPEDRFQTMTEVISALEELEIAEDEETLPVVAVSPAMHETVTLIDTSRDLIKPTIAGSDQPPKRRWGLIAGGVFGFVVLLAGLIIKLQTPAGTIVLEIDQPELIGAVVTIDGEKKITIKTGKGMESIEIRPDEKRHELEIKIDGFKTFAKDFTFETGNKQTIRVRLEPLKPQVAKAKPATEGEYTWPKDQPAPAIAPFNAEQAKQHQEAWAKHLGVEIETTNSIGMKFKVIPPGEFLMGTSDREIEKLIEEDQKGYSDITYQEWVNTEGPQHNVTLTKPFGLAAHEVTRGQFRQFVEATGFKTTAEKRGRGIGWKNGNWVMDPEFVWHSNLGFETEQTDDHPVVNVTWNDAVAFCHWLSETEGVKYRLPTEAEWEFACRAGSLALFSFGDDESKLFVYAWFGGQGGRNTKAVGGKKANPWGLYDVYGNVSEWCDDASVPYNTAPAIDPIRKSQAWSSRVVARGGTFIYAAKTQRSAYRHSFQKNTAGYYGGFRIVRTFDKPKPKTTHIWPEDQPAPAIAPFNAEQAKQHQEAWAKHLGVEVETTNSIGMKLRVIPPGEFLMGSSDEEIAKLLEEVKEKKLGEKELNKIQSEGPQHLVILTKPFSSSIHEVTRGQFRQFVEATGYQTDAEKEGRGGIGDNVEQIDDHPVVNVSWNDAVVFCEWLSEKENLIYRLPTEAEWEYTCRAGSLDRFSFGNEESLLQAYAWYVVNSGDKTKPVGQKTANALGVFDMYGNVREWCGDRFGMYENTLAIDPIGPIAGSSRLLRGGTAGYSLGVVRSAHRLSHTQSKSSMDCGFRIVSTFEKPTLKQKTTHIWPEDQPAPAIGPFNAEQAKQHQEAWAKHLGVEVETTNSIGMKLRVIPPGEFLMGSSEEEIAKLLEEAKEQNLDDQHIRAIPHEGPQHKVTLTKPFGMSIQEVTRSHFLQFVEATGYKTDAEKDGKGGYGFIDGKDVQSLEFLWNSPPLSYDPPVVNISWDDAVAFSKWLSSKEGVTYRLPTEAEWEWCCRAGSLSRYSHGDDESLLKEYAVYALDHPTPPSMRTANGLGLFDMQGNVWEWCHDTFAAYTAESTVDPVGPHQGNSRSLRGGGYYGTPLITRSAVRLIRTPNSCYSAIGFRIVRTFEKPAAETGNTQPKNAPAVAPVPHQKAVKSESN